MYESEDLKTTVLRLIAKHKEGEWWDFKEKHHQNKAALVHDIICMQNRLSNHDAYIIYGVKDNTYEIIGVENDQQRKNQQAVIDLLRAVKFSGDYRPSISLDTFYVDNHEIDVLTVRHSNNVPVFLSEPYRDGDKTIHQGCIYTRVGDTNTPINSTADYHIVGSLWEKRFGLFGDVREKLNSVLDDYKNWIVDWGNKKYAYNKKHPEFQISLVEEFTKWNEPISLFYMSPAFYFAKLTVNYFNTIIYESVMWSLDDYRVFLPCASTNCVYDKNGNSYPFYCYFLDSVEGRILVINTKGTLDMSSRYKYKNNPILIFKDKMELIDFKHFYTSIIDELKCEELFNKPEYADLQFNEKMAAEGGSSLSKCIPIAIEAYSRWQKERDKLQKPKKSSCPC